MPQLMDWLASVLTAQEHLGSGGHDLARYLNGALLPRMTRQRQAPLETEYKWATLSQAYSKACARHSKSSPGHLS